MLSKPFSFLLVFVVIACNIVFMLSPLILIALPFVRISENYLLIDQGILQKGVFVFWFTMFVVIGLVAFYLLCDFLFGFSYRSALSGAIRFEKTKDCDFLAEVFKQLKEKFGTDSVKLYIKNSNEINAFAVGSLGRGAIVLTRGLIDHYLSTSNDPKTFLYSLRSVLGHEMSHLINKDFFPAYLIITNQKITNFISRFLHRIFAWTARILGAIPFFGHLFSRMFGALYIALNRFVWFFSQYIVYGTYEFLRRFVSRSIEYRCDLQSAQAFGGRNMAMALNMLGKSGYFTIFSTHPNTKTRITKVEEIKAKDGSILPRFSDSLVNGFCVILIFLLFIYSAQQAHIFEILRAILAKHDVIYQKLSALWRLINRIY